MDNLEQHNVKPYKNHENRPFYFVLTSNVFYNLTIDNLKFTHLFRTHAK